MEDILKGRELRLKCKKEAREVLRANKGVFVWATALLLLLILLVEIVSVFIPFIGSFICGVIVSILSVGQISMSLKTLRGGTPKISDLFDGFSHNPGKNACIFTILTLILIGIFSLCLIPLPIIAGASLFEGLKGDIGTVTVLMLIVPLLLLLLLLMILAILLSAYFFGTYYILLDNVDMRVWDILSKSFALIKGRVWEYTIFSFSFIGWCITIPFTLGLSILWITPYSSIAMAKYYIYLIDENTVKEVIVVDDEGNLLR